MRHTVSHTTATDVDDVLTLPGIYDVQNLGDVDVYWSRKAATATVDDGQLIAPGTGQTIFTDGRTGGQPLFIRAATGPGAGQTAQVRIEWLRPADA